MYKYFYRGVTACAPNKKGRKHSHKHEKMFLLLFPLDSFDWHNFSYEYVLIEVLLSQP